MKILFPIFDKFKTGAFVPNGVGLVATVAKQGGHDCFFLVQRMDELKSSFYERYENALKNDHYDCVAFGGLSTQYKDLKKMMAIGKSYNCHTILGSYLVDSNPELIAKNIGADYCITGEGEYSFLELVDALEKGRDTSKIKGVINAKSGNFSYIPNVCIKNLDELPFIDVELTNTTEFIKKYHCLTLTLSRSCPYKCTFCYHLQGANYRVKSIDYIFQELDYYVSKLGGDLHSLFIMDDCFNVDNKRVSEFCKRIKEYNLPFRIQTRIEYMNEETICMLKDAGCIRIAYGIESASNKILKSMKKNLTIEKTIEVLDLTNKHGIIPDGLLIVGDVEEDLETLRETEKFYFENRDKYQLAMHMIRLYPYSPLYKYAVDNNYISDEIKHLEDECPLVNVSKIPDSIYRLLQNKYTSLYEVDRKNHAPLREDSYRLSVSKEGLVDMEARCSWCYEKVELLGFDAKIGEHLLNEDYCPHCNRDIHWFYIRAFDYLKSSYFDSRFLVEEIFEKYRNRRIAIWGISPKIKSLLMISQNLRNSVVCLVDINYDKMLNETYCDLKILEPEVLKNTEFDYLLIGSQTKREDIIQIVHDMGLDPEIIDILMA